MAKVFSSGLEIGAPEVYYVNSGWTSTQTGTSTVDFAYDEAHVPGTGYGGGSRCFKAASAGYGAAKFSPPALATATSDGWVAFSWKATGASTIDRDVWVRITNATSHTDTIDGLVLKGKPTGTTYTLTVTAGGKPLGSTTAVANDGAWHHIGIHYKAHATSGVVAIYYDGSLILNYSGDTRGLGDTTTWDTVTWVHGVENDMGDGSDGSITVSSPAVLNKYTYLTEGTTAATVKELLVYDSTNFSVGDEVMLHQTQHATAAGTYEFNRINTIQTKRSLPGSTAWFNQEGVVAHWHFDEAPTPFPDNQATDGYVDMTGNVCLLHLDKEVADHSGTGNGATVYQISNMPIAHDWGLLTNKGYWFGDSSTTARIEASNLTNAPTTNGSICAWFKPYNNVSGYIFSLADSGNNSATNGSTRILYINNNSLSFFGYNADINNFHTIVNDTWNHAVMTWEDTTKLKIYINGSLVLNQTVAGLIVPDTDLVLGQAMQLNQNGQGFFGQIDEVAVFNRVLSQAEVTAIYDNQKNPAQLTDASGKGNHLTINGNGVAGDYNYFSQPGKWTGSTTYSKEVQNNPSFNVKTAGMVDMPIGNEPRTFMFWLKYGAVGGTYQNTFSYGASPLNTYLQLQSSNKIRWSTTTHTSEINFTPVAGDWNHYALVWTGSEMRAFINGAHYAWVSTMPSSINTPSGVVAFGTIWDSGASTTVSAHSAFDEAVILNYALTDDEIAGIYAVQNAATTAADAYLPVVTYDSDWVSTANMELYYKLDEAASATGADSIIDYSGNGYHGTPTSMTMGAAGQVGTCATFGGGDINAGYNSQLDFERTDSWTIGLWMRTTTGDTSLLSNWATVGAAKRGVLICMLSTGEIRPHFGDGVSGGTLIYGDTPLAYKDGNWHHVVCTYDGTSANTGLGVYIDGAAVTLTGLSGGPLTGDTASTNDWLVGNSPDTPRPFVGDLDEVFIYSRVLSAAEIQTIYRVQSDNYHTIGLTKGLKTPFYSGTFDTAAPNGVVSQMVMVPNYTSLTVDAGVSVTPDAWDGYKGGIVALKATGTATITGNIDADGKGYRGGAGTSGTGSGQDRGYQGESIKGKGVLSPTANDGGGSGTTSTGNQNSGGGGGGYTTAGGIGAGDPSVGVQPDVPGGTVIGSADLGKLHLGSGGGGGGHYGSDGSLTTGGDGGGAVYLAAETITVAGTVKATGGDGEVSGHHHSSNSGGGAGGSVYLAANTVTAGSSLVTAAGGAVNGAGNVTTSGQGGAGSAGRIRTNYANTTGTTDPTAYADAVPAAMTDQFDHLVIFDAPSDPGNSKMFIQGVRPNATFDAGAFVVDGNHLSADWFDMTGCEGLWHLDETTGTVATDSSGNSRNGTLVGVPGFTTGKVGPTPKGYEFNGTSDYISMAGAPFRFTTEAFTFSLWVKPNASQNSYANMFGCFSATNGYFCRQLSTTTNTYRFMCAAGSISWGSSFTLTANVWQHLVVVKSGTASTVYVNTASVATGTHAATLGAASLDFNIGRESNGSSYWTGLIDEVAVFSRALSAAEVKSIYDYQAPAPLAFPDSGALDAYVSMANNVGLWHFDGGATDSSGNSRNGTVSGATQVTGHVGANAYSFDGSNDYISMAGAPFRFTTESFTFSLWVKPNASQNSHATMFSCMSYSPHHGYFFRQFAGATNTYRFQAAAGSTSYTSSVTLAANVWQHVVIVKSGTASTVYVNAAAVATGTHAATLGAASLDLNLGRDSTAISYWTGLIDEFAVWSRALTAVEVTAIYNNQLPVGNPRLHQAIDDTGDLTTTSKIIAPSATSCKFGMQNATDINAGWAPGTIIAVDAVAAIRGDGSITAAKVDIGAVAGGETEGTSTAISPSPKIVTATATVDPDGAGAITTAILGGLTTKVTVS